MPEQLLTTMPLVLALVGLLVGPALYALPHWRRWDTALDSFTLAAIGGLCAFHLLPEALEAGGGMALLLAVVGVVGSRWLHGLQLGPWMLLVSLALHGVLEAAALGTGHHGEAFGMAVLLHRIPVGLVLFGVFREHYRSTTPGWLAIGALLLATIAGYGLSGFDMLPGSVAGGLEALVAGMLFHVVWEHGIHEHHHAHLDGPSCADGTCGHDHGHHDHDHGHHDHDHGHHDHDHGHHDHDHGHHDHDHHHHGLQEGEGPSVLLGTLLGLIVVGVVLLRGHDHGEIDVFHTTWALLVESAPALLIAYVLAGLLHGLAPPGAVRWLAAGGSLRQALKGVAFGLPLPICSCGVLPMYEALVRRGVPGVAAMGFLIATPELGLDALLLSVPLLGWSLTGARLVAALLVALAVALVVGRAVPTHAEKAVEAEAVRPLQERLADGVRFGLVDLVDHTLPWVLVGLLIAGFAEPLLSHPWMTGLPSVLQVPVFALVALPVYVCATGATPVAAIAIASGVSPGAALAFLLAGPATNVTTVGVLSDLHGRRIAMAFGGAVFVGAVVAGWSIDLLAVPAVGLVVDHHTHVGWLEALAIGGLAVLGAASVYRQGPRGMLHQVLEPVHVH